MFLQHLTCLPTPKASSLANDKHIFILQPKMAFLSTDIKPSATQDTRVPNSLGFCLFSSPVGSTTSEFPGKTVGVAVHVDCGGLGSIKFVFKMYVCGIKR